MANSKLLKEAIADAKAVRETAIANAKIALEEAFTPQLQSILSKKLQAEMEGEEEDVMDEVDSSDIGDGDNEEPSAEASDAHTELGPESEEETAEVGDELEEGEGSIEDPTNADDAEISEEEEMESDEEEVEEGYHEEEEMEMDEEMEDEDELDLESIIRELEMDMDSDEEISEEEMEDEVSDEEEEAIEDEMDSHEEEFHGEDSEEELDDEIDLDEILREMGYGDDEEEVNEEEEVEDNTAELEAELAEALDTVKQLQSTINEVNLLNAKLLYANRLFRSYNLNNEQKTKVVENLDRTSSVREVKLVYATLAESMNFTGAEKKTKRVVSEGASKPVASTAPTKQIISENTNELAARFKQLANIK